VAPPLHLPSEPDRAWDAVRRWWEAPDGPILVRTSGSSGRPKDVVLSRRALEASARAGLARLGGPGQWVLALPVTGVAGLQVLVRSAAAGTTPVLVDDLAGVVSGLSRMTGERAYVSLVPTQLHRLAEAGHLELLHRFDAVLVGGAALAPALLGRCREADVRVVHTYGMSETCGGCVYDGMPLDGVGVRVGAHGRISLAGPVLFDGYAGDRGATALVLRDGWFLTSDVGRIDDDGRLVVLGRADDVVVSGGVNVALPAVTQALAGLSGIRDAAAVGVPDDEWGTRVVACLVGSVAPTISDVRDHVAAVLPRTWAPRAVVLVDALPLLANGKLDRLALQRIAADAGP
jgi:O-succinylbenzoic acid--CoA ligase